MRRDQVGALPIATATVFVHVQKMFVLEMRGRWAVPTATIQTIDGMKIGTEVAAGFAQTIANAMAHVSA